MGFKKNNPGCNCCGTCDITTDDFARTDGTDIGTGSSAGWTEVSGSWEISSSQLKCTSAGVATCDTVHPDGDTTMVIEADIRHDTSASSCDIIVDYVDSSNYFYVRYKFGTNTVDIRKAVAGVHSSIASATRTLNINTTYQAMVCVSDAGRISALVNANCIKTSAPQSLSGDATGFGTSGSGNAIFDNFNFRKTKKSPSATTCEECEFCGCLNEGDTFVRTNSTDIDTGSPVGWTEVAGDWSISSNLLTVASANAIAISDTPFPDDNISVQVTSVGSPTTSMTNRTIVNYVDPDNYYCGEISYNGSGAGTLNIIERASGVETVKSTYINPSGSDITFCWMPELGRAWFGHKNGATSGNAITALLSPFVSRKWGLGTGATVSGTARFGTANLRSSDVGCDVCVKCGTYCYPASDLNINPVDEMQVVVSGITDSGCSCSSLNATYVCKLVGRPGSCTWIYDFPSAICGYAAIYVRANIGQWEVTLATTRYVSTSALRWLLIAPNSDCVGVSGLGITYASSTGTCSAASSTCTITAL